MTLDPRRLRGASVSVESLARTAQARQEAERDLQYVEPEFECTGCGALLDHDVEWCEGCRRDNLPPLSGSRA